MASNSIETTKPTPWPLMLTKYEKTRLIGARAEMLARGAPACCEIPADTIDPLEIARLELQKKVIPLTIVRYSPAGDAFEITCADLEA